MRIIKEYPLLFNTNPQSFNIQGFDEVLRVGENAERGMSVWVTMDAAASGQPAHLTFQMVEQGQPVPTLGTYIGSATIHPFAVAGEVNSSSIAHDMFVWSS